jgi:hypothetical protein
MLKMKELGIEIPTIGTRISAKSLGDPIAWPNFQRVTVSDSFPAVVQTRLLKSFRWTKVAVVYD